MNPVLAICIPTFNRAEVLSELLAALLPQLDVLGEPISADIQPIGPEVFLYVVADDSGDATKQVLESFGVPHEFNSPKLGQLPSFVRCIEHARAVGAAYVWVLGDDELLAPNAVALLRRQLFGTGDALVVTLPGANTDRYTHRYSNLANYVGHRLAWHSHDLLLQTVISGSVFDPRVFDEKFAWQSDYDYALVHGIMNGVRASGRPVSFLAEHLYDVRTTRPLYEQWPANIDRSLEDYLRWLGPNLDRETAHRIVASFANPLLKDLRNPVRFLLKHRNAILSPGAWGFFIKRLRYIANL